MATVLDDADDFETIYHDDFAIEIEDESVNDAKINELCDNIKDLKSKLIQAEAKLLSKDEEISDLKLTLANKEAELKTKDMQHPSKITSTDTLLSHEGVATTSSIERRSSHFAYNAFDGRANTRWASQSGPDKQYLCVDLGAQYNISRVEIEWGKAAAKRYEITVSKERTSGWNIVWKKFDGHEGGGTVETDLRGQGVTGRYVQMYGIERANKDWGFSIYNMKVYGSPL